MSSPLTNLPSVEILLGTYNGERFLSEQLRSLEAQTFRDWKLLARDDGSRDATRQILGEFRARYPEQVTLIEDGRSRLGARGNFATLLERSTADFALCCDQDDVWLSHKIETLLAVARDAGPPEGPRLVHSDLEVVDTELRPLASSLWQHQFIRPERCMWQQLLVQNVVTGCASLINAALRRAAVPVPAEAIMHDWWLALVAASVGEVVAVPQALVRYRQHGANDTGAKRWGPALWSRWLRRSARDGGAKAAVQSYQRQAAALANHALASLPPATVEVLRQFAELERRSRVARIRFLAQHGIAKTGALRTAGLWASI